MKEYVTVKEAITMMGLSKAQAHTTASSPTGGSPSTPVNSFDRGTECTAPSTPMIS
jgi:hypothetical protein